MVPQEKKKILKKRGRGVFHTEVQWEGLEPRSCTSNQVRGLMTLFLGTDLAEDRNNPHDSL